MPASRILFTLFLFLLWCRPAHIEAQDIDEIISITQEELTTIPPVPGEETQPGLAGAFMGVHNEAVIIAGGANFPKGPAWEGGQKVWHSQIYILKKNEEIYQWIVNSSDTLPQPLAYGVSISTTNGVLCLGGNIANIASDKTFYLKYDQETNSVQCLPFTTMPAPLDNFNGGQIGSYIYVAGSNSQTDQKHFWRIDISDEKGEWEVLPTWDGGPRTHAAGVVQNNGEEDCFYLMKGRYRGSEAASTLLHDSWEYSPSKNRWSKIPDDKLDIPWAAGTAIAIGANHFLLLGGDDGILFNTLERLQNAINAEQNLQQQEVLISRRDSIQKNHPGFNRNIWAFHTITHSWTPLQGLDLAQVTTNAFNWDGKIIVPTGEISPCIRTPQIHLLNLEHNTSFGRVNYLILVLYLLTLIGLGLVFSKNQHTTEDFFKAGNRIPWWAAGISIFGTQLSAITFMAIPAKTFATDWLYFFLMMTIIMVMPVIIKYFLPFYRRFNLTTAYEYLELRFNLITRLIGGCMYILFQLGRIGVVLLLPSVALSVVTGIDVHLCILSMGILSILYTVLGGIEAVIWTDVLQVIVLLGGALISLVILYINIDGDVLVEHITSYQKMRILDLDFSLKSPTFWVVVLGGLATNLIQYGSDQTVIQRYLTTKDEESAARSIRLGAWMALPSTFIFFTLGTLLFVFFKENPAELNPILTKTDGIFPWYIVQSLPQGISGLLIAAIFAASMSSLDSSMNSVATVVTTDFVQRLSAGSPDVNYLPLARMTTVVIGVLGTGLALLMATWGISSLWDQFNTIIGLLIGGLGGIFILGIFTRSANSTGAIAGLLVSGLGQYLIETYTELHFLFYAFTGIIIAISVGLLVSLFTKSDNSNSNKYTFSGLE